MGAVSSRGPLKGDGSRVNLGLGTPLVGVATSFSNITSGDEVSPGVKGPVGVQGPPEVGSDQG